LLLLFKLTIKIIIILLLARTPKTAAGTHGEWDTPISTSGVGEFKKPLPKKYNTNMSLDAFQTKYTSEDNASYPCNILYLHLFIFLSFKLKLVL